MDGKKAITWSSRGAQTNVLPKCIRVTAAAYGCLCRTTPTRLAVCDYESRSLCQRVRLCSPVGSERGSGGARSLDFVVQHATSYLPWKHRRSTVDVQRLLLTG